ncbi:HEAT repeat domain-containing protein [Nucisporomicrobium flavum]|uniref:HEAT repeat domain-containing protein n=1 Tax=Nucisporomicrobium flavum TaxID=2785915 RepID=UPI0018F5361D|nr:hypothetical protein [Nucisporomicrobium flavum]
MTHNTTENTDRRCAALVALVKLIGAQASPALAQCTDDECATVRRYAIHGLAVAGDDRAWDRVLDLLVADLREQNPNPPYGMAWGTLSLQSTVLAATCYLGRHLGVPGRRERVTALIREHWSRLYTSEHRWFHEFWPECAPAGPSTRPPGPDGVVLARWAANPLFTETADPFLSPCNPVIED